MYKNIPLLLAKNMGDILHTALTIRLQYPSQALLLSMHSMFGHLPELAVLHTWEKNISIGSANDLTYLASDHNAMRYKPLLCKISSICLFFLNKIRYCSFVDLNEIKQINLIYKRSQWTCPTSDIISSIAVQREKYRHTSHKIR